MADILELSHLKDILLYDKYTGIFKWVKGSKNVKPGDVAGGLDADGYCIITIDGKHYRSHRLAWFWVYGIWPTHQIDHENHIRHDNRIENLRDVSNETNHKNLKLDKRNKSSFCGVHFYKRTGKWRADITVNKVAIHLGYFDDKEDAIKSRKQAMIEHNFHSQHGKI